jgi:hypothetical protein
MMNEKRRDYRRVRNRERGGGGAAFYLCYIGTLSFSLPVRIITALNRVWRATVRAVHRPVVLLHFSPTSYFFHFS